MSGRSPARYAASNSVRSWPAQKPRPSPVKTMHRTCWSSPAAPNAASSSPLIVAVSAFNRSGRLRVIHSTAPSRLTAICSYAISPAFPEQSLGDVPLDEGSHSDPAARADHLHHRLALLFVDAGRPGGHGQTIPLSCRTLVDDGDGVSRGVLTGAQVRFDEPAPGLLHVAHHPRRGVQGVDPAALQIHQHLFRHRDLE